MASTLDGEFERFKAKLLKKLNLLADGLPSAVRTELHAELVQLAKDPELRARFVRSVFTNDNQTTRRAEHSVAAAR